MDKQEVLKEYRKLEDRILLSQVLDKIEIAEKRNQIQYTDFLDMYQVALVKKFLNKNQLQNYILYGGFEDAERKIAIFYSDNYDKEIVEKDYQKMLKVIRVQLGKDEIGKYTHRNYLGGIIKLGMKREKVGDILVADDGADIIVKEETAKILSKDLETLTRFQNSKIDVIDLSDLRTPEIKVEEIDIIVSSLRLDNIASDLARTSRSKIVQVMAQERVFINGQCETKPSKAVKMGDVITIRGKGRFVVKEIKANTRSGRMVLSIEKYV